jgi:hypothetical protein
MAIDTFGGFIEVNLATSHLQPCLDSDCLLPANFYRNVINSYIVITSAGFVMADRGILATRNRSGQPDPTYRQALVRPESVRAFFAAVAQDIVPPKKHFV